MPFFCVLRLKKKFSCSLSTSNITLHNCNMIWDKIRSESNLFQTFISLLAWSIYCCSINLSLVFRCQMYERSLEYIREVGLIQLKHFDVAFHSA